MRVTIGRGANAFETPRDDARADSSERTNDDGDDVITIAIAAERARVDGVRGARLVGDAAGAARRPARAVGRRREGVRARAVERGAAAAGDERGRSGREIDGAIRERGRVRTLRAGWGARRGGRAAVRRRAHEREGARGEGARAGIDEGSHGGRGF